MGLGGAGGAQGVKNLFSNMVRWQIKLTGTMRTKYKKYCHRRVKLVTLARGQKSNIIKISLIKSILTSFIPNFTNKRNKTYKTEFSFCDLGYTPGVGFRCAGGQKLEYGDL